MLDYLAHYESVQDILILGIVFAICTYAIGHNARRAMLVKDVEAENEMRRKIQWHNIQNQQLIESSRSIVEEGGNE